MELKAPTVLISGGSRGIGRSLCEHFCESGYRVSFIYKSNDVAADEVAKATGAYPIKADISDSKQVLFAVQKAQKIL